MAFVVIILSLFIAALGVLGIIAPQRLVTFAKLWQTPRDSTRLLPSV